MSVCPLGDVTSSVWFWRRRYAKTDIQTRVIGIRKGWRTKAAGRTASSTSCPEKYTGSKGMKRPWNPPVGCEYTLLLFLFYHLSKSDCS
nr:unnamed protein product [Callosobruchus analis]